MDVRRETCYGEQILKKSPRSHLLEELTIVENKVSKPVTDDSVFGRFGYLFYVRLKKHKFVNGFAIARVGELTR